MKKRSSLIIFFVIIVGNIVSLFFSGSEYSLGFGFSMLSTDVNFACGIILATVCSIGIRTKYISTEKIPYLIRYGGRKKAVIVELCIVGLYSFLFSFLQFATIFLYNLFVNNENVFSEIIISFISTFFVIYFVLTAQMLLELFVKKDLSSLIMSLISVTMITVGSGVQEMIEKGVSKDLEARLRFINQFDIFNYMSAYRMNKIGIDSRIAVLFPIILCVVSSILLIMSVQKYDIKE